MAWGEDRRGNEAYVLRVLRSSKQLFRNGRRVAALLCARQVSPDEALVAWGEDRRGNEAYVLRVRDIATGKDALQRPIEARRLPGLPVPAVSRLLSA